MANIEPMNAEDGRLPARKAAARQGMTVSLAALVVSGFLRGSVFRTLHWGAGAALLGFVVWHHLLNRPAAPAKPRRMRRTAPAETLG